MGVASQDLVDRRCGYGDTGPVSENLCAMLTGGSPRSLGRTAEVVGQVLADRSQLGELFACIASPDAVVRMRAADALEKVCRRQPGWFEPWLSEVLTEVGRSSQPSLQWHTAQILGHLHSRLDRDQRRRSVILLQSYLTGSRDWIVLNATMGTLAAWAREDVALVRWLRPELERLTADERGSVRRRATKLLATLPS